MSQVIGEHYPELEIKKIIQEQDDHPIDQPEPIREARKRSGLRRVLVALNAWFARGFNGGGRRKRLFDSGSHGP